MEVGGGRLGHERKEQPFLPSGLEQKDVIDTKVYFALLVFLCCLYFLLIISLFFFTQGWQQTTGLPKL